MAVVPLLFGAVVFAAVPLTERLTNLHRRLVGNQLGEEISPSYTPHAGLSPFRVLWVWLRDRARWRDVAFLALSATAGLALSILALGLAAAAAYLILGFALGDDLRPLFWGLIPVALLTWWLLSAPLVWARASPTERCSAPRARQGARASGGRRHRIAGGDG